MKKFLAALVIASFLGAGMSYAQAPATSNAPSKVATPAASGKKCAGKKCHKKAGKKQVVATTTPVAAPVTK